MIVTGFNEDGEDRGVETDEASRYYGWVFYKHPDGQWITLRKAKDDELRRATHLSFLNPTDFPSVPTA